MRPVSGKKVVWVVFGGLALATGLAAWWFWAHAESIRHGEVGPRGEPEPTSTVVPGNEAR